jgi:hypothetical protein
MVTAFPGEAAGWRAQSLGRLVSIGQRRAEPLAALVKPSADDPRLQRALAQPSRLQVVAVQAAAVLAA